MNNIKLLKTQSLLKKCLQEAFFELNDTRLNSLSITRVECKKGKEHAKVFFDMTGIEEHEQKEILKLLKKANNFIKEQLQNSLNWYKAPNLSYEFDKEMQTLNRLDSIFKQIHKKDNND